MASHGAWTATGPNARKAMGACGAGSARHVGGAPAAYARRHAGLRRARRPLAFRAAVAGLLGA
jgi:hypothetical protein